MKIGMICRADNSGLGTLSWEFARNLKPAKVLIVHNGVHQVFLERYEGMDARVAASNISDDDVVWLLEGTDIFFTIETPYRWDIVTAARKKGVKTVLYTMCEMTPMRRPLEFDHYLCPSKLDKEFFPNGKYIPTPLATDRLLWKKRDIATTFIHSASHGGINGRKGTKLIIDALPYVKSDFHLKIFSWKPFEVKDPRVTVEVKNFKNYWQIWREGDVLIYPQGANGICLPIVEAMACGLGVITTDLYPFNEYMPKRLLFEPKEMVKHSLATGLVEVMDPVIDPRTIAAKIDETVGKSIVEESLYGYNYAQEHSWNKLHAKYENYFLSLMRE